MTDFVDDLPHRKPLGPAAVSRLAAGVFMYPQAKFFLKRDRDNTPKTEVAVELIAKIEELHPQVNHLVCFDETTIWMIPELEAAAKACAFKLTSFRVYKGAAEETTIRLKKYLTDLGIQFKPIRNLRSVSFLNIGKFISENEQRFSYIDPEGHSALGVEAQKDPTFQELVQRRRRDAWP